MDNKEIFACPKCAQKLSVPTDHGTLQVTCPSCKATWEHPAIKQAELDQMFNSVFGGAGIFDFTSLFEKARIRCNVCQTDNPLTQAMKCKKCGESRASSVAHSPARCKACQTLLDTSPFLNDPMRAFSEGKCPKCGANCFAEIFFSLFESTASAQSKGTSSGTDFQQANPRTGTQKMPANNSDDGSSPLPDVEEPDWSKISLSRLTIAGWLLMLSCAVPMALGLYFGLAIFNTHGALA